MLNLQKSQINMYIMSICIIIALYACFHINYPYNIIMLVKWYQLLIILGLPLNFF
jgi:hypothetical protein